MSPTQTMEFTLDRDEGFTGKAGSKTVAPLAMRWASELATASQLTRTGTPWQERDAFPLSRERTSRATALARKKRASSARCSIS